MFIGCYLHIRKCCFCLLTRTSIIARSLAVHWGGARKKKRSDGYFRRSPWNCADGMSFSPKADVHSLRHCLFCIFSLFCFSYPRPSNVRVGVRPPPVHVLLLQLGHSGSGAFNLRSTGVDLYSWGRGANNILSPKLLSWFSKFNGVW